MLCNQCGGRVAAVASDVDVRRSPSLTGLMLACRECGRPIRLLHRNGAPSTRVSVTDTKRALRSARRMKLRQS